jgi:hypothetical protein
MAEFQVTHQDELLKIVKFIRSNPENKRSTISCPEHGKKPVIIIDDDPEQPIRITGCCQVAIDEKRRQIGWVVPFAEL